MKDGEEVAVVTGAARGIGRRAALTLAAEGYRIAANDLEAPEETLRDLREAGVEALSVPGDVSEEIAVRGMVGTILENFGRLDVLVNNAGISAIVPAEETTMADWNRTIAVNLTGPFLATKRAIGPMLEGGGGVIVNIASVGGLRGGAAGAAYTASKHGLIGLTKNTAANYAADGIRCIAICPGGVDTGIGPGGDPSERGYATLNCILPAMPHLASPAEIANVALFCASDEASFLNGAVILADGGWTAH